MAIYTVTEINGTEVLPWAKPYNTEQQAKHDIRMTYPDLEVMWDEFNHSDGSETTGWVWGYSLENITFIITRII